MDVQRSASAAAEARNAPREPQATLAAIGRCGGWAACCAELLESRGDDSTLASKMNHRQPSFDACHGVEKKACADR
jgi:hypothetical protein